GPMPPARSHAGARAAGAGPRRALRALRERSRDLLLHGAADHLAQLGRVLVAVCRHGVNRRRLDEVVLAARHGEIAADLARHLPAVDEVTRHASSSFGGLVSRVSTP